MMQSLARAFRYDTDGGNQHVVLPFQVHPAGARATHPVALGGKLVVARTGHVSGMMLDEYDPKPHGTMASERLAVWSMDDDQLERLATVARDALALRRAIRALR